MGNRCWMICVALLILAATAGCKPEDSTTAGPPAGQTDVGVAQQGGAEGAPTQIKGRVETIGEGEDAIDVIYVEGTPYEMGYAHGKLMADKVRKFVTTITMAMCIGMQMPASKLDEAWAEMEPFVSDDIKEEMRGLAEGSGLELRAIQRAHTIPDVSEFHCTFFASWGKATRNGHLIQIRALDYATEAGIQNFPAILVAKPVDKNPFVLVGWVGFVGCVSGISGKSIAVSEIGTNFGDEKETLAGEPFPFLLRRVLEEADTLDEAVSMIQEAKRTTSYLYCVGDGKVPDARALMTCKDWAYVFDAKCLPNRHLTDTVYFSMGEDSQWNEKVYETLKPKVGQIDENVAMMDVMRGLGTGDLHSVAWDVTDLKMWVANCTTATPGTAGEPGYGQNFVAFDVAEALGVKPEKPPAVAPAKD